MANSRADPGKRLSRKSAESPKACHVNTEFVDDPCERVDLLDAGELRFVDHENVHVALSKFLDVGSEIAARFNGFRASFNPNATRHHAVVASIAEGPERDVAAPLT